MLAIPVSTFHGVDDTAERPIEMISYEIQITKRRYGLREWMPCIEAGATPP
jgi:hypothetical protein